MLGVSEDASVVGIRLVEDGQSGREDDKVAYFHTFPNLQLSYPFFRTRDLKNVPHT